MKYFAYGSNMSAAQMRERNVRFTKRGPARLKGWRLVFNKVSSKNDKAGFAGLVPDENETAEGALYEIPEEDIRKLDRFEGYPHHYQRTVLEVMTSSGEQVKAEVYLAVEAKTAPGLRPEKKYLSLLLEGRDLLSENYYRGLAETETAD